MTQNSTLANILQLFKEGTLKLCPETSGGSFEGGCGCKKRKKEKSEQLRYYTSQKQMIIKVCNVLNDANRNQEQRVMGKILLLSIDYITKILQFLNQDHQCQCQKQMLQQYSVLQHKVQFLREENSKFFKLFECKNNEYEQLLKKMEEFKMTDSKVLMPTININKNENKNKNISFLLKNQSISQIQSLGSSIVTKTSQQYQNFNASIQENPILDHSCYFGECSLKKQKKSRIF